MNVETQGVPSCAARRLAFAGVVLPKAVGLLLALLPLAVHAQLPSGTWQYAWGDDFSGKTLDQTKWSYNYPWGTTHNHDATMNADNAVQGDGTLTLVAQRTGTGASFRSGAVSSGYTKTTFNGGYIEARIRLPDTPGSWPAFWGLYSGWPPEMDIMEYPIDTAAGTGYAQDQYHTAFHYTPPGGGNSAGAGQVNPGSAGDLGGAYHTFGVNWVEDSSVTFYFDGAQVSSFNNSEVAEMVYMYLILNYAVGGWPGTPSTTEWPVGHRDETKIDWVRVWNSGSAKTSDWVNAGASEYALWDAGTNWNNGVPNLGGVTSTFGTVTPAQQNIDWSGRRTLSVMNLDGNTRYRFGWPDDRLVLGYGNGGSIAPAINVAATANTDHEIYGQLEWSGALGISNNSSHVLLLTGRVMGGDGININGPGVVSFDGTNTYSGNTVIDSGAQGPGIARARGQNAFGTGGTVIIGESGNSTTARLELENDCSIANNINLNGRNNASVGIVNNSGSNTISGTVSAQSGGSTYLIQSDSGKLMLKGAVALSSGATGTRTFTLQGAADGVVAGIITNGSATVNLVKTGTGTWTLEGQNTYTGTTIVSNGTLVVNGMSGSGGTTVGSGAVLGGRGTVRSNLVAQTGATVRIGGTGLPQLSTNVPVLIDDFESYPVGDITSTANSQNTTGRKWVGVFDGTANADIVDISGDQALAANGTASAWRGAITDLQNSFSSDFSLPHGKTNTYFFRVRRTGTGIIDAIFGLTDQVATFYTPPGNDTADPWNEYAVMLSIFGDTGTSMLRAYDEGDGDVNVIAAGASQWINVWITVNNAAKSYRVATSTGLASGTDSGRSYDFGRRTAAMVGSNPLVSFGMHEFRNVAVQFDDFQRMEGSDLRNPLGLTPVLMGETLTVQNALSLAPGTTLEFDILSPTHHDRLMVGGSFTADGILKVQLHPGAPAPVAGDAYQLFQAGSSSGAFTSNSLPALNPGLAWNLASLTNGVLSVIQTVTTNPTNLIYSVTDDLLTLSWPAGHVGWRLQMQANVLATGLSTNWVEVAGSTATNQVTMPISAGNASVFFRLVYPFE
jgi:autotransporter-associated beta strand protein